MMGTGGGSPKDLELCATENSLLNFLTPDASGLKYISEGGFTDVIPSYGYDESALSCNIEEKEVDIQDIFTLDTSNDSIHTESYKIHFPIQQNKQYSSMSLLNSNKENMHATVNNINSVCIHVLEIF